MAGWTNRVFNPIAHCTHNRAAVRNAIQTNSIIAQATVKMKKFTMNDPICSWTKGNIVRFPNVQGGTKWISLYMGPIEALSELKL